MKMKPENKFIRTSTEAKGGITPEEKVLLDAHTQKWIKNAFQTGPLNKEKITSAIEGLYEVSGLKKPRVVIVPSPYVMAMAYGHAAYIWDVRAATDATHAATDATHAATDATRAATRDATYAATNDATRAATDAATRAATGAATHAATNATPNAATYAATRDATDAANAATYAATRAATYAANAATGAAIDAATRDATFAATDAANAATRAATHAATHAAIHAAIRAVNAATHAATDAATDAVTHAVTHAATFAATDAATHAATDAVTRSINNEKINKHIKNWSSVYQSGNMWTAYNCFLTAFRDVIGLDLPEYKNYKYWEEASMYGGFRVMHKEFCMVCEFPEFIKIDDNNRPHCEDGPSHRWTDGWSIYNWHGVSVPKEWIENKETLTAKIALTWENIEQRRCACEILGWATILSELNATIIDTDIDPEIGELLEVELPDLGKEKFLKVLCGTGRTFALPVPPEMTTALEAQAWTWGMDKNDFVLPEIRT